MLIKKIANINTPKLMNVISVVTGNFCPILRLLTITVTFVMSWYRD
jgi:hypothetical protein